MNKNKLNTRNFSYFVKINSVVKVFLIPCHCLKKQSPGFPNYKQTTEYENVFGGQFDVQRNRRCLSIELYI